MYIIIYIYVSQYIHIIIVVILGSGAAFQKKNVPSFTTGPSLIQVFKGNYTVSRSSKGTNPPAPLNHWILADQ